MRMIQFFEQKSANQINLSDKAVIELEELTFGGFRVPQGFCVTDYSFWRNFTLESGVRELLRELPDLDEKKLKQASAELRSLILSADLDDEFLQGIYMALLMFGLHERYAVSLFHVYGLPKVFPLVLQRDLYYLTGIDEIVAKIKECWAAWWTEEAIVFRRQQRISSHDLSVIIQQCPPIESSGLLFTTFYGSRLGKAEIFANYGFLNLERGSSDYYYIERKNEVIQKKIGFHQGMFPNYNAFQEKQRNRAFQVSCLSDSQILQLASLGGMVENIYGEPQCIAWGMSRGDYYLLRIFPQKYLAQRKEIFQAWKEKDVAAVERNNKARKGGIFPWIWRNQC